MSSKGNWDRYVPLPTPILPRLRDDWRTHRSREWLFPAPTRRGLRHSLAHHGGPVTRSSLQRAFRRAVLKSGIAKHASVHTLRHYAASRTMPNGVVGTPISQAVDALRIRHSPDGLGSAELTKLT